MSEQQTRESQARQRNASIGLVIGIVFLALGLVSLVTDDGAGGVSLFLLIGGGILAVSGYLGRRGN